MSNPFTQDHHGLTKEAYNPAVRDATSDYSPSYVPPAPEPSGQAKLVGDNYKNQIGQMVGKEYASRHNSLMNDMTPWERLRLIFTTGIGKFLDFFNVKHNFYNRANELKRQAGVRTVENMMGTSFDPDDIDNLFGTPEEWKDPNARFQTMFTDKNTPFYQQHADRFETEEQAIRDYTTAVGAQDQSWFGKMLPGEWNERRRFLNRAKENPDWGQRAVSNAYNPQSELNRGNFTPTDRQGIIRNDYEYEPVKYEGTFTRPFADAFKKLPEPEPMTWE